MLTDCPTCIHYDDCEQSERLDTPACINYRSKPTRNPTNADRIRSMSDEELAVWIAETSNCSDWCGLNERCSTKPEYECCVNVWLEWLREECKSED